MTTIRSAATESAMSEPITVPLFAVISGAQVQHALQGREKQIVESVEATYRLHSAGDSVNPPSYFLRFPDRPSSRIIALPASIGGQVRVDGLKWISSFPDNVVAGIPRASAVLILNDYDTGYPFACLESSIISATRTAGLAALAADWLSRGRRRPTRVGFFGAGLIARYIHTFLAGTGWTFDEVGVHDLHADIPSQVDVRRQVMIELAHDVGRRELLRNLPGLADQITLRGRRLDGLEIIGKHRRDIPGECARRAREAQVGRRQ